ncbi:MAG: hypothetical protein QOE35_3790 [Actinomycetota bacterium]|jgi:acetyltransferase-like isoleucine patch superfamily enzyme
MVTRARTQYYRSRYRAFTEWGAGACVHGPLRLRGPGRIVVGAGTVFGPGSGSIHAAGPGTVRIGAGCHLNHVDIAASDNVTIGNGVQVRDRLRIAGAGRVTLGDGCDIASLEIVATGDVTIGDGTKVVEHARLQGGDHITIGESCKVNELDISAAGDVSIGSAVRVRSKLYIGGKGRVVIGDRCVFELASGTVLNAAEPTATVRVGAECGINGLDVYAGDDVTIGDRCMVGECSMVTTDFHSTRRDRWAGQAVKRGPITVGANVWLADRTVITKNVSIGDNSVVSIGTIVREDVPANVIVSSHHQRIVKELPHDP